MSVKDFWKSVFIWWSYKQKVDVFFKHGVVSSSDDIDKHLSTALISFWFFCKMTQQQGDRFNEEDIKICDEFLKKEHFRLCDSCSKSLVNVIKVSRKVRWKTPWECGMPQVPVLTNSAINRTATWRHWGTDVKMVFTWLITSDSRINLSLSSLFSAAIYTASHTDLKTIKSPQKCIG